ncbi:MAG: hypothetical protein IKW59_04555 [Clostridia bacterium]|nr:hypothetical protein [Clostridia bacterium]
MKKVISLTLMLCMMASLLIIPVHAAECCHPGIESIVQNAENIVVNWNLQASTDNKSLDIRIWHSSTTHWSYSAKKTIDLSETETLDSAEFDNSLFLKGETYYVAIACKSCNDYNCWNFYNQMEFVSENGSMQIYDIGDELSDEIVITQTADKAIHIKANETGLYCLEKTHIDTDPLSYGSDVVLNSIGGNNFSNYKLMYLEEGQEELFTIRLRDTYNSSDSISTKFRFAPVSMEPEAPKTENPSGGDIVYDFNGLTETEYYYRIDIAKYGVYKVQLNGSTNYSLARLYDKNGNNINTIDRYTPMEILLNPGTYYLQVQDSSAATITYQALEAMEFGSEITISGSYIHKTLTLDTYALIYDSFESRDMVFYNIESGIEYWASYDELLLPKGEYIVRMSTWEESVSGSITKQDIPTVTIGDALSYATSTDEWQTKYALIKAPEAGEYVFFCPNSVSVDDGSFEGLAYIEFKKDETKLFSWRRSDFTAAKHTPKSDTLSIGENLSATLSDGNKQIYSFTAPKKDSYKIIFNSDDWISVKIYTEDAVLCERGTEDYDFEYVDLDENETVYIRFRQTGLTETLKDANIQITVEEKYTYLTETTDIDCSYPSDSATKLYRFTPTEAGYYNFSLTLKELNCDYYEIFAYLNGESLGKLYGWAGNDGNADVSSSFYVDKDNPVEIKIEVNRNQNCKATLNFETAATKPITDMNSFKIEDNSYYSVILPETGVYKITGKAFYKATTWREEGEYSYFFTPIIKNNKDTSFSCENSEGEAFVYFCGNAGDEILFKEGSTSYYEIEYPISASIVKVDTAEIRLDSLVTTTEKCKLYSINITEDGEYKFEDFSEDLLDAAGNYYGTGFTYFYDDSSWISVTDLVRYENVENVTFELKAGTYYIAASTSDKYADDEYIPEAKFKISKNKPIISGSKTSNGVDYTITGTVPNDSTLYAALYDGEKMKELKPVKNPLASGSITFDNAPGAYNCKLFLWDENLNPLCNEIECE